MKKVLSFILSLLMIFVSIIPCEVLAEENYFEQDDFVKESVFINVGNNENLGEEADNFNDYNERLIWSSSNSRVATVSKNGRVSAVKAGKSIVSATAEESGNTIAEFTVFSYKEKSGSYINTSKLKTVSTKKSKYTYNQMKKDLKALSEKYSSIMTYSSAGKTCDNRDIFEVVIGNPNAQNHILVQASMHAREYMNSLLVMREIEAICANYYTGAYDGYSFCELFEETCLHVVPMTNPDGVSISQFGTKAIRDEKIRKRLEKIEKKYAKGRKNYFTNWKSNAMGVDLNINFPQCWNKYKSYVKHPGAEGFKGKSPTSENETRILMEIVKRVKPKAVISYHSTGSMLFWNFRQSGSFRNKCKSLYKVVNGVTGYFDAEPNPKRSIVSSNFGEWVCNNQKIPTVTVETGKATCPLPIKEYNRIWSENKYLLPAVALWCR